MSGQTSSTRRPRLQMAVRCSFPRPWRRSWHGRRWLSQCTHRFLLTSPPTRSAPRIDPRLRVLRRGVLRRHRQHRRGQGRATGPGRRGRGRHRHQRQPGGGRTGRPPVAGPLDRHSSRGDRTPTSSPTTTTCATAPDRCYHCKTELYTQLEGLAERLGVAVIAQRRQRRRPGRLSPRHDGRQRASRGQPAGRVRV